MTEEKPSLLVYGIVGFAIMTLGYVIGHQAFAADQPVTLRHVLAVVGVLVVCSFLKRLQRSNSLQLALWAIDYGIFGALVCMAIYAA